MLICKTNLQENNWTSILISDGENRVPPKPDGQTYRHTDFATKKGTKQAWKERYVDLFIRHFLPLLYYNLDIFVQI